MSDYCGSITWNRVQRCDQWGQHKPSKRAADEVVIVEKPELQIVSEKIWQQAQAKRERTCPTSSGGP